MRQGHMIAVSLVIALGSIAPICAAGYYYGRVIDKTNAPVQGVAVSLDIQKLSATTNAQGVFTLGTTAVSQNRSMPYLRPSFSFVGSRMILNNYSSQLPALVRLFSIQGRLLGVAIVRQDKQAGSPIDLTKNIASTGDGCYVLQVRYGSDQETVFFNRVNGAFFMVTENNVSSARSGAFSAWKKAAVKDTLNLSKTAFLTNRIFVADTGSNLGDLTLFPTVTGTLSNFYGFNRYDFQANQKNCIIVTPKKPAAGNPWIWRAYFFDHKPYIDSILCSKGYYLGYVDLPDQYGCPTAVNSMSTFYSYITATYGFSKKPLLYGISRGGLYVYNWGRSNISKLSCICGDGACFDIVSWPCGCYATGSPSPSDWALCKTDYGFANDSIAKAYTGNPYQNMRPFADAKIPLINVYGTADPAAVPNQNVLRANDSLKKYNWQTVLIAKPGIGHVHGVTAADGALPGQADTLLNFFLKNTSF